MTEPLARRSRTSVCLDVVRRAFAVTLAGSIDRELLNGFDQVVMHGVEDELEPVRDAELVKDVMKMIFDCLFANEEVLANFLARQTLVADDHALAITA